MKLTKTESTIVTALLAVCTYLQSELQLSHPMHVGIVAFAVFAAGLGITSNNKSEENTFGGEK